MAPAFTVVIPGVYGAVCARHGYPLNFMNMNAGEKYIYGDSIVNKMLRTTAPDKMFVFYDIACQWMKHLNVGYVQL